MDVHTDRRMSGRTDEITCVTLITQSYSTWKKELYFSYVLRGLLIICKNTVRVEQDHVPCIMDPIFFYPSFKNRQVYVDEKE